MMPFAKERQNFKIGFHAPVAMIATMTEKAKASGCAIGLNSIR